MACGVNATKVILMTALYCNYLYLVDSVVATKLIWLMVYIQLSLSGCRLNHCYMDDGVFITFLKFVLYPPNTNLQSLYYMEYAMSRDFNQSRVGLHINQIRQIELSRDSIKI